MIEFDKTKVAFVLALLGTMFAIHPVVVKFEKLGFEIFGLSLRIEVVYTIFTLLLALATYLYAICFVTQKPFPVIPKLGNIVYAISLIVPLAYFLLFVCDTVVEFAGPLVNRAHAEVVFSFFVGIFSSVLAAGVWRLLAKRDRSAAVKHLSKEEKSYIQRAAEMHDTGHLYLTVLDSFHAMESALRKAFLNCGVQIQTRNFSQMVDAAVQAKMIPKELLESIRKVQKVRNEAIHNEAVSLSREDAKTVLDISKRFLAELEKANETELEKASQIEELRRNSLTAYLTARFHVTVDSIHATVTSATSINDFANKLEKVTGRDGVSQEVMALFERYPGKIEQLNSIRTNFGLSKLH